MYSSIVFQDTVKAYKYEFTREKISRPIELLLQFQQRFEGVPTLLEEFQRS